ncbi:hypothetical protein L6164_016764 [Bauhinia variegata]|uniref:Uncharacterized protein n=1 Tax=Bauhinia variegata TaxID=167791 RepID=A0ACB9N7N9_BAUVA|nr:hypothetical protein L6164_016764 [Bauhinia variegata]
MNSTTSPHVEIQLSNIPSARFRRPLLKYLPQEKKKKREIYRQICVPLYNLALQGNWKEASRVLQEHPKLRMAAITNEWKTILHVAAGTDHVHFVEELLKLMGKDGLELQDYNGNPALFSAATTGNMQIAEILGKENESLPTIRGKESVFPVQLAALQGQRGMARYLYKRSSEMFGEEDYNKLFLACIKNGIYSKFGPEMSKDKRSLAFTQDEQEQTGLHILARKQFTKSCKSLIRGIIRDPLFDAAKVGNSEFLAQLMSTYHQANLMWEIDEEDRNIIHFAVLHRHAKIFNLIHKIGVIKDVLVTFEDAEYNNLLHCAAKLAPPEQLNSISGAAFQMMDELIWFEEVKKVMQPSFIERRNSNGLAPRKLFSKEHEELLEKAKSWMERTANSCMLVSTVIATGVLSAAFSIPGGDNDDGIPHYLKKPAFLIFAVSDATALISASTENDFLSSLPFKLMIGLLALM